MPTIMNLIGPLANPAGARRQVVGVADPVRARLVAHALARLGAVHALVLHAAVGMDEVSPSGETMVWEIRHGSVGCTELRPADHGLECHDLEELAGGEPAENARRIEELLAGRGRQVERCAVLLNAAAALYVSGRDWTFEEALARARDALEAGAGAESLARLRSA